MNRGYDKVPAEPYEYGNNTKKNRSDAKSCARFILVLLVIAGAAGLGVGLYNVFSPPKLDEGPLFIPDPPPVPPPTKKRTVFAHANKRMSWSPRSNVITATSTIFTLQYPEDLSDYTGQRYIVYSNSTLPHQIVFTPAVNRYAFTHCPRGSGGHPTWDDAPGQYPVARFIDGQPGAFLHWYVVECGRVAVIEHRHVEFCTRNLTECVIPVVTSANITELFASTILVEELTATMGVIGNLSSTDFSALRAVLVNLTASSINTTELTSVFAHITTLITQTFTATTATITHLFATTGEIDQLTSTLFTALNGTVTHLESVTAAIQNLFVTNANITSLTGETATITNITTQLLMADQIMNTILEHTVSGVIPATHARQTLQYTGGVLPGVNQTAGLTIGNLTLNKFVTQPGGSIGFFPRSACWQVRDLITADPLTSVNDTGGIRVIQGGFPNTFAISSSSADSNCPTNNGVLAIDIMPTTGLGGTLQIFLRYGTEAGLDFVTVTKDTVEIFRGSGSGPTSTNAFLETTLNIQVRSNENITITYRKNGSRYSGYDILYFYAILSPPTALAMTLPADLSAYIGKDISVCSLDNNLHTIGSNGSYVLDPTGSWPVLQLQGNGNQSCCVVFSFNAQAQVSIKSRDACSVFCSDRLLSHCVDPLRPAETNKLHGNWKGRGKRNGFAYARIDASVHPIAVKMHGGTVITPTESFTAQTYYAVGFQVYSQRNITDLNDSNGAYPLAFRVQPGSNQLFFHIADSTDCDMQLQAVLMDRIAVIPPMLPSGSGSLNSALPPDNPEAILRNLVERFIYGSHNSLGLDSADQQWIGTLPSLEYLERLIKQGSGTFVTNITEARVTRSFNPEQITEFRFATYHHVSPISRVTISGYDSLGTCALLNGNFIVNVATTNNIPLPSPLYEDYSDNPATRTVHHKLGVFLNSVSVPVFPNTSIANCTGTNNPIATVSYGPINANSNYMQTMGAAWNWFYETARVGLHFRIATYFNATSSTIRSNMARPLEEWKDVVSSAAAGRTTISYKYFRSRHLDSASAFYPNGGLRIVLQRATDALSAGETADNRNWAGLSDLTGRFGIRPDQESSNVLNTGNIKRSTHSVNIPLLNYLEQAAYPAWKVEGTTRTAYENLLAQVSYPGGGGDVFNVTMVPMGSLPPTFFSYLYGSSFLNGAPGTTPYPSLPNFVNQFGQDLFFVGKIKPAYTSGLNIGYWRIASTLFADVLLLSTSSKLCPFSHCENNRDALTTMYGVVMNYLLNTLNCDHVILDIRGNTGGFVTVTQALRDLFGGAPGITVANNLEEIAGTGFGGSYNTFLLEHVNNRIEALNKCNDANPSATETNEPGSVLTNGEVVILTDTNALSGGDKFPNVFLGNALDGQLGNSTRVSMVGSVDGRLVSCSSFYDMPFSQDSSRLKTSTGLPLSPLQAGIDGDCPQFRRADGSTLANRHPGLLIDNTGDFGLAGGNALWADWEELVYKDLGYVSNTRPVLPGWPFPQTPFNMEVTNVISTTAGSNIVTVTMPVPHGFTTGDDVALGSVAIPVAATGGINTRVLTGSQNITVVNATVFTFQTLDIVSGFAFTSPAATSNVTAGGGTFRVTNRNHWRDAWLEQSIKRIDILAKKRGVTGKSIEERAQIQKRMRAAEERKEASRKSRRFNIHKVNKRYERNVACHEGMNAISIQDAVPTVVYKLNQESLESAQEVMRIRQLATATLEQGIQSGDLCFAEDGHLMAMPDAKHVPRILFDTLNTVTVEEE